MQNPGRAYSVELFLALLYFKCVHTPSRDNGPDIFQALLYDKSSDASSDVNAADGEISSYSIMIHVSFQVTCKFSIIQTPAGPAIRTPMGL